MLELRPNCEYCDKDLPPNATDARRDGSSCHLLRARARATEHRSECRGKAGARRVVASHQRHAAR